MGNNRYEADVIVVGGGIAGIVTAYELLNHGKKVLMIERDSKERFGGLAIWSFGGMFFVDTPEQRRAGINDSVDTALRDWHHVAEFGPEDELPKKWAERYVNMCTPYVYRWLKEHKIKYFPVVHWVERGHFYPGNSFPRFHMVWGTGHGLTTTMIGHLMNHPKRDSHLEILFDHKVEEILSSNGQVTGVRGVLEKNNAEEFEAYSGVTIVAAGGMGGNIERVKRIGISHGEAPRKRS